MPNEYTEVNSKEYRATKRTPTFDNLNDIPTIPIKNQTPQTTKKSNFKVSSDISPDALSLKDLAVIDPSAAVPVNDEPEENAGIESRFMDALDMAVQRTKDDTTKFFEDAIEQEHEKHFFEEENKTDDESDDDTKKYHNPSLEEDLFDEDDEGDDDILFQEENTYSKVEPEEKVEIPEDIEDEEDKFQIMKNSSKSIIDDINNDLDEDDDDIFTDEEDDDANKLNPSKKIVDYDTMSDEDRQILVDKLKSEAKSSINPITNTINFSKFKIRKKPVSISKVMKLASSDIDCADWILPVAKRSISCSALAGYEIVKMNPNNGTRNRMNTYKDIYNIIYNHVIDTNKPDFETWLKTTYYNDIDHYYFCLYKATFGNSNFFNRECDDPTCKHNFIQDVTFNDLIKYASEDAKKEALKILRHDTNTTNTSIESELYQLSNDYAITIKNPSIWNVIIETASLSDDFLSKHADMIDLYSYIDEIFYIDDENEELIPIDYKPDANNQTKTTANKIKVCNSIINQLTSDQYYALYGKIREIEEPVANITFHLPETKCPKCGKTIEEHEYSAEELLFIRHQLGMLAVM